MAHRCILSQQSPVFRTMFSMDLSQESRDGVVVIEDFEAEHVSWFKLNFSCYPSILTIPYSGEGHARVHLHWCRESESAREVP